ncbi:hypothetical protein P5673_016866 [Acropora cervicornis]|uniref:Uncharacterized protein n=1 Tax=Acropora cervicornis TaxID=6130 RepID=A0AAD9V478_ACRCE|nr:hypothetical protein P5673_016866 [Acropora cervicornis]
MVFLEKDIGSHCYMIRQPYWNAAYTCYTAGTHGYSYHDNSSLSVASEAPGVVALQLLHKISFKQFTVKQGRVDLEGPGLELCSPTCNAKDLRNAFRFRNI